MTRRESLVAMLVAVIGVGVRPRQKLEPYGIELDGRVKPLRELSYVRTVMVPKLRRRVRKMDAVQQAPTRPWLNHYRVYRSPLDGCAQTARPLTLTPQATPSQIQRSPLDYASDKEKNACVTATSHNLSSRNPLRVVVTNQKQRVFSCALGWMPMLVYSGNMDQELIREASRRFLCGDVRPVKTQTVQIFPGLRFPLGIEVAPAEFLPAADGRWILHEPADPYSRSLNAVEGE